MARQVDSSKVRDREHPYKKDHVRLQVQVKLEPTPEVLKQRGLYQGKKRFRWIWQFMHVTFPKFEEINNKDKLANWLRNHYGLKGNKTTYNVLFYDRWHKNRYYNPNFRCLRIHCQFFRNQTCKIWKRHKKGMQCRINRKSWGAMKPRCQLTLIRIDNPNSEIDYKYEWKKEKDLMRKFKRMGWRD